MTNKTILIVITSIAALVLFGTTRLPTYILVPAAFLIGIVSSIMLYEVERKEKAIDDAKITHEKLIALGFEPYREDGKTLDYIDDKLIHYKLDCDKPYRFGVKTLKGSLGYDVFLISELDRHYNNYHQLKQEVEFFLNKNI